MVFFAIHRHESATGAYISPHPEPPPPPPPHLLPNSILLSCPRTRALSALLHASNLHWSFILHMVMGKFQCYSLHLLPQSSKVCSLHLSLHCCLAYRVIITIFLNSIYMCLYTVLVFLFLTYFTLYNRLQFHPLH